MSAETRDRSGGTAERIKCNNLISIFKLLYYHDDGHADDDP